MAINKCKMYDGECFQNTIPEAAPAALTTASASNRDDFECLGTSLINYNGNAADVVIPDGVTEIVVGTFRKNGTIRSVTFPDSVVAINEAAFMNCTSLKTLKFGKGLKTIGDYAFSGCKELQSADFPESLNAIGTSAFLDCEKLTEITLPRFIKDVDEYAFIVDENVERTVKLPRKFHGDTELLEKMGFYGDMDKISFYDASVSAERPALDKERKRDEEEKRRHEEVTRRTAEKARLDQKYQNVLALAANGENYRAIKQIINDSELKGYKDCDAMALELWRPLLQYNMGAMTADSGATCYITTSGTVVPLFCEKPLSARHIAKWSGIAQIAAYNRTLVGLRYDGTAVAEGNNDYKKTKLAGFSDLVKIKLEDTKNVFGIKRNGGVVCSGEDVGKFDKYVNVVDITSWRLSTYFLFRNGTVSWRGFFVKHTDKMSQWKDVVQISAGEGFVIGLKRDGTVVSQMTGDSEVKSIIDKSNAACNVSGWRDIVAISCSNYRTVGLRKDGTCVVAGDTENGKFSLFDWNEIVAIKSDGDQIVGLRADGKILIAGKNRGVYDPGNVRVVLSDPSKGMR